MPCCIFKSKLKLLRPFYADLRIILTMIYMDTLHLLNSVQNQSQTERFCTLWPDTKITEDRGILKPKRLYWVSTRIPKLWALSTDAIIRWTLTMLRSSEMSQITTDGFSLKLGRLWKIRTLGITTSSSKKSINVWHTFNLKLSQKRFLSSRAYSSRNKIANHVL